MNVKRNKSGKLGKAKWSVKTKQNEILLASVTQTLWPAYNHASLKKTCIAKLVDKCFLTVCDIICLSPSHAGLHTSQWPLGNVWLLGVSGCWRLQAVTRWNWLEEVYSTKKSPCNCFHPYCALKTTTCLQTLANFSMSGSESVNQSSFKACC